ncbi:MAG TPA: hypothetical protein DD723_02375 [Candidatus Omnitrophica bacterium]|nr:MAG: hypothetical protein A2Z81_01905 [Omnitrophica WOR_2 bacterium GWA2_45_18]OGX21685.1 MAG: hypothetical protein A2Y04_03080 [Omnitrophica WOR_2 bacterium GWC2_45_7]HBR14374.1 hypothetical protein [Candidatus Omnitrophota bacterium]
MKKLLLLTFTFLLLTLTANSFAVSYSLVNDWSDVTNPNGLWSYNEGNNLLQFNLPNWPTGEFGETQTAWAQTNVEEGFLPGWFKSVGDPNQLSELVNVNGPYDWQGGDVVVHTTSSPIHGADHGSANVKWTNPYSGLFNLEGGVWAGRDIGRGNDWFLYLDNFLIGSGHVEGGDIYSRASPDSFNLSNLNIQQGSIVKLELVRTTGSQGSGDFVGVAFNINEINPIPEPATAMLLGSGLLRAFIRRKRLC